MIPLNYQLLRVYQLDSCGELGTSFCGKKARTNFGITRNNVNSIPAIDIIDLRLTSTEGKLLAWVASWDSDLPPIGIARIGTAKTASTWFENRKFAFNTCWRQMLLRKYDFSYSNITDVVVECKKSSRFPTFVLICHSFD